MNATSQSAAPSSTRSASGVSALIIARNEERHLPGCLASLAWADEIVVVLDRTTDRSAEIVKQAGATLIEGAWEIEGERRNLGIEACSHPWILEVDADERATDALAEEIRKFATTAKPGCYAVPIRNHIGATEVVYGWGAYNGVNSAIRFCTKGAKTWGMQRVHPRLEMPAVAGSLKEGLLHYVDDDLADMLDRLNRYTSLAAKDAVTTGTIPSLWDGIRRVFSRGWKSYIGRKGYKEGFYGVALAFFSASYTLLIYLKARELER